MIYKKCGESDLAIFFHSSMVHFCQVIYCKVFLLVLVMVPSLLVVDSVFSITFIHLANNFIQNNLQMRDLCLFVHFDFCLPSSACLPIVNKPQYWICHFGLSAACFFLLSKYYIYIHMPLSRIKSLLKMSK